MGAVGHGFLLPKSQEPAAGGLAGVEPSGWPGVRRLAVTSEPRCERLQPRPRLLLSCHSPAFRKQAAADRGSELGTSACPAKPETTAAIPQRLGDTLLRDPEPQPSCFCIPAPQDLCDIINVVLSLRIRVICSQQ